MILKHKYAILILSIILEIIVIVKLEDKSWQQFSHKLKGFKMLGTVEVNAGDPGALAIRKSDKKYYQVNSGYIRGIELDQFAVMLELTRLKAEAKATRPTANAIKIMRVINLDTESLESLMRYGAGNVSEAIRKAAKAMSELGVEYVIPLEIHAGLKRHVSVTLDDETVARLKKLGAGNMSYGARRCATFANRMGLDRNPV